MTAITVHRYGRAGAARVVLLHGLTEAGTAWPDLVARWGATWDLLAPDLRGHGASPRFTPDEIGSAPEVLLADVVALLDGQPEPVVLLGHSLGGLLALRAALARPGQVRALVLEDPARPSGSPAPDPAFVAGTEAFLDAMASEADRARQVERMLRETAWSRAEVEAWAACKPLVDRGYVRGGLRLGEGAWEERFAALTVPTLLVLPPDAPMAPRLDRVPHRAVRTVVIPGTGHCVRRDDPTAFHRAVDGFLAQVAPPRR